MSKFRYGQVLRLTHEFMTARAPAAPRTDLRIMFVVDHPSFTDNFRGITLRSARPNEYDYAFYAVEAFEVDPDA